LIATICLDILSRKNPNIFTRIFTDLDTIKGHFIHKNVRMLFKEIFERVKKEVLKKNNNKGIKVTLSMISEWENKTRPYYEDDGVDIMDKEQYEEKIRKVPDTSNINSLAGLEKQRVAMMEEEGINNDGGTQ
jgi:hypothetical protein